jgi:hypothetical protein
MYRKLRRIILPTLALFAFVAATWVCLERYRWHPDITVSSWQRIENGMTEEQVIGIIGAPPGHYHSSFSDPARFWHEYGREPAAEVVSRKAEWWGDTLITVYFGHDNRVCATQICAVGYRDIPIQERLKNWLTKLHLI